MAARARQRGSDLSFLSRPASQRKSTQGTTVSFAVETGPEPGGRQICCGSRCHVDIFNNEKRVNLIRIILGKVATMFVGWSPHSWLEDGLVGTSTVSTKFTFVTHRKGGGGGDRQEQLFVLFLFFLYSFVRGFRPYSSR